MRMLFSKKPIYLRWEIYIGRELCQFNFSVFEISFVTYCKISSGSIEFYLWSFWMDCWYNLYTALNFFSFIHNHFVILKQKGVYKTYLLTILSIVQLFIHHQFQRIEIRTFLYQIDSLRGNNRSAIFTKASEGSQNSRSESLVRDQRLESIAGCSSVSKLAWEIHEQDEYYLIDQSYASLISFYIIQIAVYTVYHTN